MTEYKQTLNLPSTDFPMKANLPQREPERLKLWAEQDLYGAIRQSRAGCDKFIMHDGPPYANGAIHIGHALNKTLKDIVIKSKTLRGFEAPYVPGWDCHGLPIELNVEKKVGKAGGKVTADEFRQACRDYAMLQVNLQRDAFKRLGVLGLWDDPYLTMNYRYEANILRALGKIIEKGHLIQGFKPVHWCLDCRSALAEAEVEYYDKTSPAIDVGFDVLDDESLFTRLNHSTDGKGEGPIKMPIWTTTPWTLPANQAVAVNPELEYVLLQCETQQGKQRLLIAEALSKDCMLRYEIENYRVIAYGQGKTLEGLKLRHPFYDREVPVVLGDHVSTEAGTGNVHTAPGHGQEDFLVAQHYHLPIDNPVDNRGCFVEGTEYFAGEHVLKANEHIMEILQSKGQLLHHVALEHSYPHCWRHKTPVIFRATPQWFISMDKQNLRRDALEGIFKIDWLPDWGQARIAGMIENRPDWCISRQRCWGTPLPVFIHKDTQALHPDTNELILAIAKRVETEGIDAWFNLDLTELLGDQADQYEKATDTLDVWFDSGVSHFCVLQQRDELQKPADLYLEGSDQHRGWFQTSLLSSYAIDGQAPYKQVLTHGFTVDAQGRKMSKSLGNIIAPDKIIKQYGADVLRLWVASTDYVVEQSISDEILKRVADAYRRLRNTARFLLGNIHDFDPSKDSVAVDQMIALDRWAIERAQLLQTEIIEAYNRYQFHLVYQKIYHFCSIDMGSFYLDIIKDRQYTTQTHSVARRSCQTAMYYITEALVRWIAPILSFTADEIWQHLPGERETSVFISSWYTAWPEIPTERQFDQAFWSDIISVRDTVNKALEAARNAGTIGSGLAADVILYVSDELLECLTLLADELRFVLITSTATLAPLKEKSASALATERNDVFVDVKASLHTKCVRCWHRREEVGSEPKHPELCQRCVSNIDGSGESRQFA